MRWIGQHIWDFISRFRNKVYLEDLDLSTEPCTLVVDSDGLVTKNCSKPNVVPDGGGSYDDGRIPFRGTSDNELKTVGDLRYVTGDNVLSTFRVLDPTGQTSNSLTINNSSGVGVIQQQAYYDVSGHTGSNPSITGFSSYLERNGSLPSNKTMTKTGMQIAMAEWLASQGDGTTAVKQTGIDVGITNLAHGYPGTTNGAKIVIADFRNSAGSQTNYHNNGLLIKTFDDIYNTDLKIESHGNALDYFSIATKVNGKTTIKTVEDGVGKNADLNFDVDGNFTVKDKSGVIFRPMPADASLPNEIHILPNQFIANDDNATCLVVDDGFNETPATNKLGIRSQTSTTDLYAFFRIPPDMVITHINVYASANAMCWLTSYDFTTGNAGTTHGVNKFEFVGGSGVYQLQDGTTATTPATTGNFTSMAGGATKHAAIRIIGTANTTVHYGATVTIKEG